MTNPESLENLGGTKQGVEGEPEKIESLASSETSEVTKIHEDPLLKKRKGLTKVLEGLNAAQFKDRWTEKISTLDLKNIEETIPENVSLSSLESIRDLIVRNDPSAKIEWQSLNPKLKEEYERSEGASMVVATGTTKAESSSSIMATKLRAIIMANRSAIIAYIRGFKEKIEDNNAEGKMIVLTPDKIEDIKRQLKEELKIKRLADFEDEYFKTRQWENKQDLLTKVNKVLIDHDLNLREPGALRIMISLKQIFEIDADPNEEKNQLIFDRTEFRERARAFYFDKEGNEVEKSLLQIRDDTQWCMSILKAEANGNIKRGITGIKPHIKILQAELDGLITKKLDFEGNKEITQDEYEKLNQEIEKIRNELKLETEKYWKVFNEFLRYIPIKTDANTAYESAIENPEIAEYPNFSITDAEILGDPEAVLRTITGFKETLNNDMKRIMKTCEETGSKDPDGTPNPMLDHLLAHKVLEISRIDAFLQKCIEKANNTILWQEKIKGIELKSEEDLFKLKDKYPEEYNRDIKWRIGDKFGPMEARKKDQLELEAWQKKYSQMVEKFSQLPFPVSEEDKAKYKKWQEALSYLIKKIKQRISKIEQADSDISRWEDLRDNFKEPDWIGLASGSTRLVSEERLKHNVSTLGVPEGDEEVRGINMDELDEVLNERYREKRWKIKSMSAGLLDWARIKVKEGLKGFINGFICERWFEKRSSDFYINLQDAQNKLNTVNTDLATLEEEFRSTLDKEIRRKNHAKQQDLRKRQRKLSSFITLAETKYVAALKGRDTFYHGKAVIANNVRRVVDTHMHYHSAGERIADAARADHLEHLSNRLNTELNNIEGELVIASEELRKLQARFDSGDTMGLSDEQFNEKMGLIQEQINNLEADRGELERRRRPLDKLLKQTLGKQQFWNHYADSLGEWAGIKAFEREPIEIKQFLVGALHGKKDIESFKGSFFFADKVDKEVFDRVDTDSDEFEVVNVGAYLKRWNDIYPSSDELHINVKDLENHVRTNGDWDKFVNQPTYRYLGLLIAQYLTATLAEGADPNTPDGQEEIKRVGRKAFTALTQFFLERKDNPDLSRKKPKEAVAG